MRRQVVERIVAAALFLEGDARQAEVVDAGLLVGGQRPDHELALIPGQDGVKLGRLDRRQGLQQFGADEALAHHFVRVDVEAIARHIERQDQPVAVGEFGPRARHQRQGLGGAG